MNDDGIEVIARELRRIPPDVCYGGYGNGQPMRDIVEQPLLIDEVRACLDFFDQCCTKTAPCGRLSYALKHSVENWRRSFEVGNSYVANGSAIAAALIADLKVRRYANSLNAAIWYRVSARETDRRSNAVGFAQRLRPCLPPAPSRDRAS